MQKLLSAASVFIAIIAIAIAAFVFVSNHKLKKDISDLKTKQKIVEEELRFTVEHISPSLKSMAKESLKFSKQYTAEGLNVRIVEMKSEGDWGLVTLGAINKNLDDVYVILKRKGLTWKGRDIGTSFEYKDHRGAPRHWFNENGVL